MSVKVNRDQGLKPVQVVAAVIYNEKQEILIAQRKDGQRHWEFPGGKVEAYESYEQALARELKEELGINSIKINALFDSYEYDYPKKSVKLFFYKCDLKSTFVLQKKVHIALKWVELGLLASYDFLPGNQKIIMALCAEQQKL